ncbi:hypothetical protein Tco_1155624 [Tanacetum coccineum]
METQDLSRLIGEQIVEFIDSQEIDQKIKDSVKEVVTASVRHAMRAPLHARFKDLSTFDMKEILLQRMLEENYDKGYEDHKMAFEALQKSIIHDESEQFDVDKVEERTKKKRTSNSAQDSPPPPPSSTTNQGDQSHISAAPGLSKTAASTAYTAWTTTTSRLKSAASSVLKDVLMPEDSDFEAQDMGSDDEYSSSRYIPKVSLNQEWFKPLSEEERPTTPEPMWFIPSSSLHVPNNNWASAIASSFQGITELIPEHLEGPAYEVVKTFHPDVKCQQTTPIGWSSRLALSITKMKAASYPNAGLEQMVPDQMWAEEEYMYDISASYGISHWWFKRQQFYIERHSTDTNRRAIVRTHMRILSVIRIEHAVATDSAQNDNGSLEAESIVRAASTRVRFHLSTTPFCSDVQGVEIVGGDPRLPVVNRFPEGSLTNTSRFPERQPLKFRITRIDHREKMVIEALDVFNLFDSDISLNQISIKQELEQIDHSQLDSTRNFSTKITQQLEIARHVLCASEYNGFG